MIPIITAAAGFLIAVLWFDLMFDVQVWRHRRLPEVPKTVIDSIASYYRRVTTDAFPMGRLVGLAMVVLLSALVAQAIWGDEPLWLSAVSIPAALLGRLRGGAHFRPGTAARREEGSAGGSE